MYVNVLLPFNAFITLVTNKYISKYYSFYWKLYFIFIKKQQTFNVCLYNFFSKYPSLFEYLSAFYKQLDGNEDLKWKRQSVFLSLFYPSKVWWRMIYKNIKYSVLIIHNTLKISIHKSLAHSCCKYLKIQTWNEMCVSLMIGLKQNDLKNTLCDFHPDSLPWFILNMLGLISMNLKVDKSYVLVLSFNKWKIFGPQKLEINHKMNLH